MIKNNKGYTMVELMVGFTLFAILMAVFVGVIKLGSNMLMYSSDTVAGRESFEREYYKEEAVSDAMMGKSDYFKADRYGERIVLQQIDEDGYMDAGVTLDINAHIEAISEKKELSGIKVYLVKEDEE